MSNWGMTACTILGKRNSFITFVRANMLDLNSSSPTVQKQDDQLDQDVKNKPMSSRVSAISDTNVVIKADVRLQHTGAQNPALVINPPPNDCLTGNESNFLNIGVGYSFLNLFYATQILP